MITIKVCKSKRVETLDESMSAYVSFPYDTEIVNLVRSQPKRYWDAQEKQWELPLKSVSAIINGAGNREVQLIGEYRQQTQLPQGLPADFHFKTNPYDHQLTGVLYGLEHDAFLLGDEQGLGKTKQVIDIAVAKKLSGGIHHCLIICGVNGLKYNWAEEVKIHSNEDSWILGSRYNKKRGMVVRGNAEKLADLNNLPESFFLITNVESLRDTAVLDRIVALCDSGEIGMVAVDEIHKCKNSTSQQGKALLKVKPQIRVAMTGTPLLNRPLDLYIILKWLGEESHSFYAFRKHFCVMGGYGGYEVVSYKNLNELQARLADIMLRRLKEDVLDLPEKVRQTEYVEMDTTQRKIYDQVSAELRADIDRIKVSNNPLAQLIRLRQATADTDILCSEVSVSAKFDRMEALVEEATDNGRKVLIFSNWTEVTNRAKERLSGYNPVVITGETSPEERAQSQKVFTEDANCKVCIGTIGAMGTGLTLTAATVEIFLDSPWNRATKEQAEDRAHRIGTTESVNIITLVCKDTIDERIEEIVYKKGVMADMLVDGVACKDNAGLVDYLLS